MKTEEIKRIVEQAMDQFDYGSTMHESEFRSLFQVSTLSESQFQAASEGLSKHDIKRLLDKEQLDELAVADAVRNLLLNEGRYFHKKLDQYHVALPSANEAVAARYQAKASRALRKAKRLLSNSPTLVDGVKSTSKSLQAMLSR